MKLSILTFFTLFCFNSFSQESTNEMFNAFYILDTTWNDNRIRRPLSTFSSVGPNYFIIEDNHVMISAYSAFPGYINVAFYGEIDGVKTELENKEVFFARGRHQSAGAVRSFEIIYNDNNTVSIHYFNKFGKPNVYFTGHIPNKEEVKEFEKSFSLGDFETEKKDTQTDTTINQ